MPRFATYNVHDCVGRDGRYEPERIARVVAEIDADVIALQEVTLDHAGDVVQCLEEITGMTAIDGTIFDRGVGRYGNVLLSRWPFVRERIHDISFRSREPRGVIDVDFRVDGRIWRVLATHLGLRGNERREQLALIARLVDARSVDVDVDVLLGDFNVWLGGRTFRPFMDRGFAVSRVVSFPSWPTPLLKLDRILVRGAADAPRYRRFHTAAVGVASDHVPVVCDVSV